MTRPACTVDARYARINANILAEAHDDGLDFTTSLAVDLWDRYELATQVSGDALALARAEREARR